MTREPPNRAAPLLAALSVLIVAGTYLAAQIDYLRRHRPGISPRSYLWPQLTHIWLPGLLLALTLGTAAALLWRRGRKAALRQGQEPLASAPER